MNAPNFSALMKKLNALTDHELTRIFAAATGILAERQGVTVATFLQATAINAQRRQDGPSLN